MSNIVYDTLCLYFTLSVIIGGPNYKYMSYTYRLKR